VSADFDARFIGQLNVHQYNIRLESVHLRNGIGGIAGLAHYGKLLGLLEQFAKPQPEHFLIVCKEEPDACHRPLLKP
jgi:hypothetical protein